MKRILAIAGLTWKSAFRYRLFWILAALLAAAVVGLPLMLKDDGTAKGLTQILLTYTLSAVATLLGIATLWLSCGTLARDVEECQIANGRGQTHRPLANLAGQMAGHSWAERHVAGAGRRRHFYLAAMARRAVSRPTNKKFCATKFLSRAPRIKERAPDLTPKIEKVMQEADQANPSPRPGELPEIRKQVTEQVKAANTDVPPGVPARCGSLTCTRCRSGRANETFQMRVKFHTANPNPEAHLRHLLAGRPDQLHRAQVSSREVLAAGFLPGIPGAGPSARRQGPAVH